MISRRICAGLVVAAAFLACDSPTGPADHHAVVRVSLEQTVTDAVTPDDTLRRFSFVSGDSGLYGVYVQLLEGQAYFVVRDTVAGVRASLSLSARTGPLEAEATLPFIIPGGRTSIIDIYPTPRGSTVRFRFKVHRIDVQPEHQVLGGRFTIGDSITTESLDDILDVDEFTTSGTAGQEIDAAIKATGTPGTEGITIVVTDPNGFFLTYTFTSAGEPGSVTGRFVLPTSGTYRFRVQSVYGAKGRYTGPYVFWTYFINRAPEHRAASLNVNAIITGEDLAPAGDVDEYALVANPGAEFKIFLQSKRSAFVRLQAFDAGGNYLAFVDAVPADTGMFEHATARFSSPTSQTKVVVSGENDHAVSDTGAYRLYVYAINPLPEHQAAAIAPGDTVSGESIDMPGDVDEFTFSASAGAEYNAFVVPQNADPDSRLQLQVLDSAGTVLRTVERFGSDTGLLEGLTGRFVTPSAGVYRLRVSGVDGFGMPFYHAAYRLALYQIDRQPESAPRTFAFGDSLSEAIDVPGDVDEFVVTVPDSSGANLAIAIDSGAGSGGLIVQLLDSASGQLIATGGAALSPARGGTGRLSLAPRKYLVRVWPSDYEFDRSSFRGRYRLWFYKFSFRPEVAADTFAIGDTVTGESIEPMGDVDRLYFYGVAGEHVNVMVQGLAAASTGWFQFLVVPPPGVPGYGVFLNAPTSGTTLEDVQSNRLDLLGTGWYTVSVNGGSGTIDERGPYRFTVLDVDPGPEHVGATLSVGDSVTNEPIDKPGDWDEFTLVATPGRTVSILFDGDVYTGLSLVVRDPATGDTLAWQPNQFRRIVGPFLIPSSGQVKIAVAQPADFFRQCYNSTCNIFSYAGPYRFWVLAVNPAPETAAATFAVGDTVRGESISPQGDIDEFTSTGTPGQQLSLLVRLTAQSTSDSAIVVEAIDPATGTSLAGSNAATWGAGFFPAGTFTVPASGAFKIRAHAWGQGYGVGVTPQYEFVVKPGP